MVSTPGLTAVGADGVCPVPGTRTVFPVPSRHRGNHDGAGRARSAAAVIGCVRPGWSDVIG
jgi:hypothetical protein